LLLVAPDAAEGPFSLNTKSFQGALELKADSDTGEFRATFATLNVVDRDGDVTSPGAFTEQPVKIASWGHQWTQLPVGLGTIRADSERAWVDGQFFLDTTPGRDTYTTVKRLGGLQEWSYGFEILDATFGQFDGKDVRFLKRLNVFEVSPVLLGAGIGTRTDSIKSPFSDHLARVLDEVGAVVTRAGEITSLRAKEGRTLSAANRRKLEALLDALGGLDPLRTEIADLLAAAAPPSDDSPKAAESDPSALFAEWLHIQARLAGHLEYAQ
jgi:HK97 family phage prohead protease